MIIERNMRLTRSPSFFSVAILALAVPFAGEFVCQPQQGPRVADLIVALGGDGGARVNAVQKLYAEGWAPRVLLTGVNKQEPSFRARNSDWRAELLLKRGLPPESVLLDFRSRTSWDEAVHTLELMDENGWQTVLVVSDPPHMRRLSWVWSKVFAGTGRKYVLMSAGMSEWSPIYWWANPSSAWYVMSEIGKLAYYMIRY